jgi:pyruvate kinase
MVDLAEKMLEKGGYVRPREVIAIVAGTRTKSGSTNFLRLHVMGENAAAQPHSSAAAQSAPAGRKRAPRSARAAAEAQKPEFSEAARSLAAKY